MEQKKLLFINSCVNLKTSRTYALCLCYIHHFLEACEENYHIEKIDLQDLKLQCFDEELLRKRDLLLKEGKRDDEMFSLARKFILADEILLGAPYWDFSFPSMLKVFFEHIMVNSITFSYDTEGRPIGHCKAKNLTYITTAGGYMKNANYGFDYIKGLNTLMDIKNLRCIYAEGLDIIGNDVESILDKAEDEIKTLF